MEYTDKQLGRPKTKIGTAKSSHRICKLGAASSGAISSARIIPTIRIVQIFSPQIFQTDAANFRALVQKLTGKKPAPKKLNGTVGSKKGDSIEFNKSIVRAQSAINPSHASTVIDEHFFPKQERELDYHVVAPLAAIKTDSMEEDRVQVCDNFSELFGGLEELGFLGALRDSGSMLPEFPMIYPPTAEQIDHHSSILWWI